MNFPAEKEEMVEVVREVKREKDPSLAKSTAEFVRKVLNLYLKRFPERQEDEESSGDSSSGALQDSGSSGGSITTGVRVPTFPSSLLHDRV